MNQTRAGNTAVFVVDEALMRAAAFGGPVPPEVSEDSQNFYYYYEDDADDTNVRYLCRIKPHFLLRAFLE